MEAKEDTRVLSGGGGVKLRSRDPRNQRSSERNILIRGAPTGGKNLSFGSVDSKSGNALDHPGTLNTLGTLNGLHDNTLSKILSLAI